MMTLDHHQQQHCTLHSALVIRFETFTLESSQFVVSIAALIGCWWLQEGQGLWSRL